MDVLLRYRGREVTQADVRFIRELIAAHPGESRRQLSKRLCLAWGWKQANGALRDMVCRSLMLALERAGYIRLPAVKKRPPNPLAQRARPQPPEVDRSRVRAKLGDLARIIHRSP